MEEELHGKPMDYGTPAASIIAVKRRLLGLMAEKALAIDGMENAIGTPRDAEHTRFFNEDITHLNQAIEQAKERIRHHEFQQGSAN